MRKKLFCLIKIALFRCLVLVLGILVMANLVLAQNTIREEKYEWEKIIPLVTKKSEVEKLFGKPFFEFKNGVSFVYNTKFGKLGVLYTNAKESEKSECKWNVDPDTVEGLWISLSDNILLSKSKYDLSLFEKELGHLKDFSYQNKEKGISIFGYISKIGEEWVSSISYYPTLEDKRCKCIK
jgi:hypothetical protein